MLLALAALGACDDAARSGAGSATTNPSSSPASSAPKPPVVGAASARSTSAPSASSIVEGAPPPSASAGASAAASIAEPAKIPPSIEVPAASSFASEPPRFLGTSPRCEVPRGMPTWRWDTLMRVEGLDVDAVVLTLDAGLRVENLEKELDILRERKLHATVFLFTGELSKSPRGPEVVKRILADGHELGNHTLSHKDMTKLSDDEVGAEVDAVESFVKDAAGATTKPWYRAPFLATNDHVEELLRERCYRPVWMTIYTGDDKTGVKSDDIVRAVEEDHGKPRRLERGAILLFHGSQPENLTALPKVLDWIHDQGFAVLPLGDAMRIAKPR